MELDFPPLDESALAQAPAAPPATVSTRTEVAAATGDLDLTKFDLQAVALAHFSKAHADVAAAKEKLANVVHDLSTLSKIIEAKSLRQRLINAPLAEARKVSAGLKSKLTKTSAAVGAELVSIETGFDEADKLITPQIEAREAVLAAEKAERDRIEAERVAALQARLDAILACATKAEGLPSERILNGIALVEAVPIKDAGWQEFEPRAAAAKEATLATMHRLLGEAEAREEAAAAAEAIRIEQVRIADEQAATARRLQAEADALAEQKRRDDEAAAARLAELERREREIAEQRAALERQQAEAAEAARKAAEPPASEPAADANPGPAGDLPAVVEAQAAETAIDAPAAPEPSVRETVAAVEAAAPAVVEVPTLKLGDINARLAPAVSTSADGLASLGFAAVPGKGVAKLYRESDWPAIKAAIVAHINSLT